VNEIEATFKGTIVLGKFTLEPVVSPLSE